jgi:xanthine dehydrogenase accessory factor
LAWDVPEMTSIHWVQTEQVLAVKNGVTLPRDMEVAQAKNLRAVQENDPGALVCGVAASR